MIDTSLLVTLLESLRAWMKHGAGHPLLTGSIAGSDWTSSMHKRVRLACKSAVCLHFVHKGKHGCRSGISDTVGGFGIVEGTPLDLASLIGGRKVHVEGPPILDGITLRGVKDVTTE